MDQEQDTAINTQTKEPIVDDSSLVEIAQKRKIEAERKRKSFKIIVRIISLLLLFTMPIFIGLYIFKAIQKEAPSTYTVVKPNDQEKPETPPIFDTTKPESWTLYKSDRLKVFIRSPNTATTLEANDPATKVDIVYDKTNASPTSGNENDLTEGFIFRVTPLNVGIRNIDDITKIKVDSYKVKCPVTAVFSEVKSVLVDTVEARTFEITKCNGDYVIYYVPRFNIYYEIAEIYKGDVGFKQKYRATLDEMTRAFRFFPEDTPPVGPFATFIDEQSRIIFTHPNLDETCCNLPKPPAESNTIVMFGNRGTYIDSENFDGIGVFTTSLWGITGGFNEIINNQKRLLREDYKVATGVDPTTNESQIRVGKYDAIRLSGYSWRGNDLIYVNIAETRGNTVVVFSIKQRTDDDYNFENAVQQILNTFETY